MFVFAGKVEEDADSIQLWCGDYENRISRSVRQWRSIVQAVSYLTEIYAQVWEELSGDPGDKKAF